MTKIKQNYLKQLDLAPLIYNKVKQDENCVAQSLLDKET